MMTSTISSITKAVILAAGKGTRMNELTSEIPKPMIPVDGIPVLERILTGLITMGIRHFLIITGYKAEVIESHFRDGAKWNVSISYSRQMTQDGTGRVVELGRDFVKDDAFLLSYGDILVSNKTYASIQNQWINQSSDALLTVKLGEDIRHGGAVIFDHELKICDLVEKPTDHQIEQLNLRFGKIQPWYNAGIYVFLPSIFTYTSKIQKSIRGEYELTDAIRSMIQENLNLRALVIEDYWVDVRDPEVLARVNEQFHKEKQNR